MHYRFRSDINQAHYYSSSNSSCICPSTSYWDLEEVWMEDQDGNQRQRRRNSRGIGEIIDGPPHHPVGSGTHVGKIDERNRRIKDNYRAIQASLPFKFGDKLSVWAIKYSTYILNLIPMRVGDGMSPREILTGIKPEFKKVLPVAFGDFCQVQERVTSNSVTIMRTTTALALLPTGHGSVMFTSLSTGCVITRDQFKIMKDVPAEYYLIIKSLQERGVFAIENVDHAPPIDNSTLLTTKDPTKFGVIPRDVIDQANMFVTTITLDTLVQEMPAGIDRNCMSIKQAFKAYPIHQVKDSVKKELNNMITKNVFEPVPVKVQHLIHKRMIVPSKLFLKAKSDGTLKSRLVAGGHRQHAEVY